jgi:hypothetical protein
MGDATLEPSLSRKDAMKALLEVTISVAIVLGVVLGVLRLMRPMMLDSMGGDTPANRARMRWVEKTTLVVAAGCALAGCLIVLLISGS